MARVPTILSINFPMSHPAVTNEKSLKTTRALFDFDVVVIRPYALRRTSDGRHTGNDEAAARTEMTGKKGELIRVLDQGGLIVVVLDKVDVLEFDSGSYSYMAGAHHRTTNYDFLSPEFSKWISNGDGTRVNVALPGEPFASVLRKSDIRWTAYFTERPAYPFWPERVFASNGSNAFIGSVKDFGSGHLVFLPNFVKLDEAAFIEVCAEYRFRREGTVAPEWAAGVFVPRLIEATAELEQIEATIAAAEKLKQEQLIAVDAISAHKKLLFEKGKYQLEPAVRRALDLLGFGTEEGERIQGTAYEIDGRTTVGSIPGVLEVKGSKNQINFDEFSPFVIKLLEDSKLNGMSKGILVGNGLCEKPPQSRHGDEVFTPHVLTAAKGNSVVLINSVELYWLICGVMTNSVTNLEQIREMILSTSGYLDLRPFCKESPFASESTRKTSAAIPPKR